LSLLTDILDEGGTLPVTLWDGAEATLTDRAATIKAAHPGVQTCFIDKHQPSGRIGVSRAGAVCKGGPYGTAIAPIKDRQEVTG
jgi:hypothetical protein